MKGWIKLHRKIKLKGYYKKSQYIHLWVHLLLSANKFNKEFLWNNQMIIIKEGQLLTGRKQLSEETGIPEGTIEKILTMLEREQQIEQQKTTKYRVITIVNWVSYQEVEQQRNNTFVNQNENNENLEQQLEQQDMRPEPIGIGGCGDSEGNQNIKKDNSVTTEEQQKNTNKNINKVKKDKNINTIVQEKFDLFWSIYPRKDCKKKTLECFIKINPDDELFDRIIGQLKLQIDAGMMDDKQYTPMPTTWLNQERWNNQIITKRRTNGNDGKKYEYQKGDGEEFKVIQ